MARGLDSFSILKRGNSGNRIAIHISPCRQMANVRFAGMALTVISLAPPIATIKGIDSQ